jgi:predicted ATPase
VFFEEGEMIFERNNFYVLSGGPGVGKTTLLQELERRGIRCVAEPARAIIQAQVRIGGDALHHENRAKFRDLMLSHGIFDYEAVSEKDNPVFFDRGIAELYGYAPPVPDYVRNAIRIYRYNPHVFMIPPWKDIYRTDAERTHTWEHAVAVYHDCKKAYTDSGYLIVEVPPASVEQRADYVLKRIGDPQ